MAKKSRDSKRSAKASSGAARGAAPRDATSHDRAARSPFGRRVLIGGAAVVVALAVATLAFLRGRGAAGGGELDRSPFPAPPNVQLTAADRITNDDFVGAARCASCHQAQFAAWSTSTHARAGGAPGHVAVIGPFDGKAIRFRDATVVPSHVGEKFAFTVKLAGETDTTYTVDAVIGGGHMEGGGTQGFLTRWRDGTMRFLPFDYSRQGRTWFCNTGTRTNKGWVPIDSTMALADCGDWPPSRVLGDEPRFTNCQSCHGSQITLGYDSASARWTTKFTTLAINCESCHGPGKRHIALVSSGDAARSADIGMRPLATLTKDQSLGVCFQCHAVKDQVAGGYLPGKSLEQHYSIRLAQLGDAPHLPDGRVRTFAYQQGHLYSDCYVSGGMTCTSCHDPHTQGYRDIDGRPLVGRFDDRQCTSCHASKSSSEEVAAHTKHSATSAGSRCVACHMPYLQEPELGNAVRYARSDHAIPIPRPAFDSSLGVASACKQCHAQRSEAELDAQMRKMWGEIKPHPALVDALVRVARESPSRAAAASLVLDSTSTHDAAVFHGLAWFLETQLAPDMPGLERDAVSRLEALARRPDPDIQAIALASLHYAAGGDRSVRNFLRDRISALGPRDRLVRDRWAIVLGFLGDRARAKGDPTTAIAAYENALEIESQSARVLLNLGLAYNDANDPTRAIERYQQSIGIDGRQSIAFVNLGLALEAKNDLAQAVDAYRRAIAINPYEAIAYFNLGNAYLRQNDAGSAIPFYERATAIDPSLALAHLYLSRSYGTLQRLPEALAEARRALRFAPENEDAKTIVQQLEAAGVK